MYHQTSDARNGYLECIMSVKESVSIGTAQNLHLSPWIVAAKDYVSVMLHFSENYHISG